MQTLNYVPFELSLQQILSITKKDIRSFNLEALQSEFVSAGHPAFRGKQAYEWLWKKGARSFDEMSNLSIETRNWLHENYSILSVTILTQ